MGGLVRLDQAVKEYLATLVSREALIIGSVCESFAVSSTAILGRSQFASVTWARAAAYWLFRYELEKSFPEIAHVFTRDHTTVINQVAQVDRRILENHWPTVRALIITRLRLRGVDPWAHLPQSSRGTHPAGLPHTTIEESKQHG